jgi:adenosylhomocysteine nucleosidase
MKLSVLVSANAEWETVKQMFPDVRVEASPFGEYFFTEVAGLRALFFHGGWGKVAAAASAQYIIDRFKPAWIVNLAHAAASKEGSIDLML